MSGVEKHKKKTSDREKEWKKKSREAKKLLARLDKAKARIQEISEEASKNVVVQYMWNRPCKIQKNLREKSGEFTTYSLLAVFFYELMRDEVTPGRVEALMISCQKQDPIKGVKLTNGWLAQYAEYCVDRLMGVEEL